MKRHEKERQSHASLMEVENSYGWAFIADLVPLYLQRQSTLHLLCT